MSSLGSYANVKETSTCIGNYNYLVASLAAVTLIMGRPEPAHYMK